MVAKRLVNGSVTIAQEGNLLTWGITTEISFAIINKINNRFRIFWGITFSVVVELGM